MASLDNLPPDQRAVLQLVLQRRRSYDEIAQMLSIDRAAVRERALAAFDALGPATRVPPERRALITDYLLGQLPSRAAEDTRGRLGESANERAWARVVASELGSLTSGPLPEIPVGPVAPRPTEAATAALATTAAVTAEPVTTGPQPEPVTREPQEPVTRKPEEPVPAVPEAQPVAAAVAGEEPVAHAARDQEQPPPEKPPTSRRGGVFVLAGFGAVILAAIVFGIISLAGGSSTKHTSSTQTSANAPTTSASASTTSAPSATTTTSTTSTASAQPVAQVNLTPLPGDKALQNAAGAAVVVKQGTNTGIVIRATGLPANTAHDAYAVWLYNSPNDNHLLGFVNPGVKSDGVLQAGSLLPPNVSHFKVLLVTLETQAKPHGPGKTVLKGPITLR
jgi:outer membrane biosynthesis protein TonB